ncbi:MAG: hydantoinase B/oxoprolinase family protein, partial [Deltaproteobacteria bacterium]|nr:hydantoinase B/oxoprolinase family protein [Deltaproteobacteria bacterium]
MERSRPTGGRERLAARTVALSRAVDPITFEVLRHRLWTINDEAAAVLRVVSGSPVATETHDYNTMLMDAQGHAFVAGTYMMSQAIGQDLMVQHILRECAESPGFGEDDVFLCSNPYVGAAHQNDVTCLAPIYWKGELVAWSGVTIHEIDVGGPVPGSQCCIGAKSIYEEAPVIPPLKLVEGGRLRKDIEEEYLNRSRTRDLNAMDLRAKLAALHTVKQRLHGLVDRYGVETVRAVMTGMIEYAEARLRARLRELPDGTWRHTAYVDYYDAGELGIYPIRLTMTKQGDRLIFDFRGSAKQAPAVVNCSYAGLLAGIMGAVIPYLCYDMPWSPAGVLRVIEVRSEPGTICHAAWPAGVCKATTAATPMVNTAACVCVAKMLSASEDHRQLLMAPWMSLAAVQEVFGVDQRGEPFGVTMLDPMAGGGGARTDRDGIDTGGIIRALSLSIANVETYEFRYPFLYLARRQEPDSGGAGRFRGGMGVGIVYTPHPVAAIPTVILHTLCNAVPGSVGLAGGYPACTNQFFVLRDSDLWERFARGELPGRLDELQGHLEVTEAIQATSL